MASVKAKRRRNKYGSITYRGRRGSTHTLYLEFKDKRGDITPNLQDAKGWVRQEVCYTFGPKLLKVLVGGFMWGMDVHAEPNQRDTNHRYTHIDVSEDTPV